MVSFTPPPPGHFIPGEKSPDTHSIKGWVGPKAGLDDVEKRKFFTLTVGRPASRQSLYRLVYEYNVGSENIQTKGELYMKEIHYPHLLRNVSKY
jgi:hypothetical protein